MPGCVIEDQQDLLARDRVTPPARPRLQPGRDLRRRDPGGEPQAGQGVGRADRPLTGSVGVQRDKVLPVGEARGQLLRAVRLMPRSRSLTDRGLSPAASASSSCVRRAPARSRRSSPAKLSPGSATGTSYLSPGPPSPDHAAGQQTLGVKGSDGPAA
jgi:hypothetical protein